MGALRARLTTPSPLARKLALDVQVPLTRAVLAVTVIRSPGRR